MKLFYCYRCHHWGPPTDFNPVSLACNRCVRWMLWATVHADRLALALPRGRVCNPGGLVLDGPFVGVQPTGAVYRQVTWLR